MTRPSNLLSIVLCLCFTFHDAWSQRAANINVNLLDKDRLAEAEDSIDSADGSSHDQRSAVPDKAEPNASDVGTSFIKPRVRTEDYSEKSSDQDTLQRDANSPQTDSSRSNWKSGAHRLPTKIAQDSSRDSDRSGHDQRLEGQPSRSPEKPLLGAGSSRPHIVMIVADDLGWNDVHWRDSHMYSPVLDSLAAEAIVLNQSYVQPVCSPTRAAFMSGYFPYHLGLQHKSLRATQNASLPGNVTTLPQHLKRLGYSTHMAGKWHLGFCNWRYTPTFRGFDSFVGYYNAIEDYYTHIGHHNGYDFRNDKDVFWSAKGEYSAFVLTRHIERVISEHNKSQPLFVYLPYQSVHGPLEVPKYYEDKYCSHIKSKDRRTRCGMVAVMDEGVGNVTRALKDKGLFDNTLLFFTTDNGGPVPEASNNWPLRGSKTTLWEGGTRGISFLHGPNILKKKGSTYNGMIHAVDWLPTLVEAAGGEEVKGLDGVSQWKSILNNLVPSARTEFIYNIDELKNNSALRQGRYKLIQGKAGNPDSWYPPPSDSHPENFAPTPEFLLGGVLPDLEQRIQGEPELQRLFHGHLSGSQLTDFLEDLSPRASDVLSGLRSIVQGRQDGLASFSPPSGSVVQMTSDIDDKDYQLFDLEADPTEHHDVKQKYPDVLKRMVARLHELRQSLVPANFPPHDPASFPQNFNGTWSPGWC